MADLEPWRPPAPAVFGMLSCSAACWLAGLPRLGRAGTGRAGRRRAWAADDAAFFRHRHQPERAVAIGHGWAYSAPLAAGHRRFALLAGAPLLAGQSSARWPLSG